MIDLISLIDSPKCSPGAGLFMIQNWAAGQRRLVIPAPISTPASPHQHGGQISTKRELYITERAPQGMVHRISAVGF